MIPLKLCLQRFGQNNVTREFVFRRNESHFTTNDDLFMALYSLLDPNFVHDEVTKPTYRRDDSFAMLEFKDAGQEAQHSIKRIFGANPSYYIDGKQEEAAKYYDLLRNVLLWEPCSPTPQGIIDQVIHKIVRETSWSDTKKRELLAECNLFSHFYNADRMDEVETHKEQIEQDMPLCEAKERLEGRLIPNVDICTNKLAEISAVQYENRRLRTSTKEFEFDFKRLLNDILEKEILTACRDMSERLITSVEEECGTCNSFRSLRNVLQSHITELTSNVPANIRKNQQLTQYAQNSAAAYSPDSEFILMYRRRFRTPEQWNNEKALIAQKDEEEEEFHERLNDSIDNCNQNIANIDTLYAQTLTRVNTLMPQVVNFDLNVRELTQTIVTSINAFYIDSVLPMIKNIFADLTIVMNDPNLDFNNIKFYISALVHSNFQYSGEYQPNLFFNNVEFENDTRGYCEHFLLNLSKILFFPTIGDVNAFERRIADEPRQDAFEQIFIFAANEMIQQMKVRRNQRTCADDLQYTQTVKNLLSHFSLRKYKNINSMDLTDKNVNYKGGQIVVAQPVSLFDRLRDIVRTYVHIVRNFENSSIIFDGIMDDMKLLVEAKRELHECMASLRINLLKLNSFNCEKLLLEEHLSKCNLMVAKLLNRRKIFAQLLGLGSSPEDYNSSVRNPQSLFQHQEDVSELLFPHAYRPPDDAFEASTLVEQVYDKLIAQRERQTLLLSIRVRNQFAPLQSALGIQGMQENQQAVKNKLIIANVRLPIVGFYSFIAAKVPRHIIVPSLRYMVTFDRNLSRRHYPMGSKAFLMGYLEQIRKLESKLNIFRKIEPEIRNSMVSFRGSINYELQRAADFINRIFQPHQLEICFNYHEGNEHWRDALTVHKRDGSAVKMLDLEIIAILLFIYMVKQKKIKFPVLYHILKKRSDESIFRVCRGYNADRFPIWFHVNETVEYWLQTAQDGDHEDGQHDNIQDGAYMAAHNTGTGDGAHTAGQSGDIGDGDHTAAHNTRTGDGAHTAEQRSDIQ